LTIISEFGFGKVTPPHQEIPFAICVRDPSDNIYNPQQTTTRYKKTAFKANWQWKHIEERIGYVWVSIYLYLYKPNKHFNAYLRYQKIATKYGRG
jgi:hypothetical protein